MFRQLNERHCSTCEVVELNKYARATVYSGGFSHRCRGLLAPNLFKHAVYSNAISFCIQHKVVFQQKLKPYVLLHQMMINIAVNS